MSLSNDSCVGRRPVLKSVAGASLAGMTGLAGCLGDDEEQLLFWTGYFGDAETDDDVAAHMEWYEDRVTSRISEEVDREVELEMPDMTYEDREDQFLAGADTGDPDYIQGLFEMLVDFAEAGHLEPITDRAQDLDYFDGYIDGAMDAMEYQGEIYGLPFHGNGRGLVYRRDVFDEYGWDPPEDVDEWIEMAAEISADDDDMWGLNVCTARGGVRTFQEWVSHMFQLTDNVFVVDEDGNAELNVDEEDFGKVFDIYHRAFYMDDPETPANPDNRGTEWQVNDPGYLNGQFATIHCGTWIRGWTEGEEILDPDQTVEILEERTGIAHLPRPEGGDLGTYLEVKPVMLNAHSEQIEESWIGLREFTSVEGMEQLGDAQPGQQLTPVHEDVESRLEIDAWEPFVEVMETGRPIAPIRWGPAREAMYDELDAVVFEEKDPWEAGEDLYEAMRDIEDEIGHG